MCAIRTENATNQPWRRSTASLPCRSSYEPRQQTSCDDLVDRGGRERRQQLRRPRRVARRQVVECGADRELVGHEARVELARQGERGVGTRRRRGDQRAAVGQGLELRDAVVLARRGGDEDAGAAEQGPVLVARKG